MTEKTYHKPVPADQWDSIFSDRPVAPKHNGRSAERKRTTESPTTAAKPKAGNRPTTVAPGSEPGIHLNVPFADYLAWPHLSNTLLGHMAKSPAHFRIAEAGLADKQPTAAMQLGTLIHAGILEPDEINQRFAVMPDFAEQVLQECPACKKPRATNRYRELCDEFAAQHAGKEIITESDYQRIVGIFASLADNERARGYLNTGKSEVSIVWDDSETGIRCKARIDYWQDSQHRIVDLKSTSDIGDFERSILRFAYHRKMAFYRSGIEAITGRPHEACLIAAETDAPHCIRAAPLGYEAIEAGQNEYRQRLKQVAECRESGEWPGPTNPETWELPSWSLPNSESVTLSVAGETFTY